MSKTIVMGQQGLVFMGEYSVEKDDLGTVFVVLRDAACIRVWGTKHGLGEIALRGPTKNTVLDPCGVFKCPVSNVLGIIHCK